MGRIRGGMRRKKGRGRLGDVLLVLENVGLNIYFVYL